MPDLTSPTDSDGAIADGPSGGFLAMATRFFTQVDEAREAELAADDARQAQRRRDFLGGAL